VYGLCLALDITSMFLKTMVFYEERSDMSWVGLVFGTFVGIVFNIVKFFIFALDLKKRRFLKRHQCKIIIAMVINFILELLFRGGQIPVMYFAAQPYGYETLLTIFYIAAIIVCVLTYVAFIIKIIVLRVSGETVQVVRISGNDYMRD
jgi:hypothetical protein